MRQLHARAACCDVLCYVVQEIMSPLNQKDILAAAKAAGKVIPVQIYLFSHYDSKYGYYFTSSKQLEDLIKSLDPKLVKVVGELAWYWPCSTVFHGQCL